MPENCIKITMLGASRVGKTSLLAAMCDRFNIVTNNTSLQIDTGSENAGWLQNQLASLKSVANLKDNFESTSEVGVRPTQIAGQQTFRTFKFELGSREQPSLLHFEITDYPGEYFSNREYSAQREALSKRVLECAAVIIAIDAPALMEEKGRWNDLFNRPTEIMFMFQRAYKDLREPRLVLLAPMKCEKYVHDVEKAEELRVKIKEAYSGLLSFLSSGEREEYVAVVITPVQTLGNVEFSHLDVKALLRSEPRFIYHKVDGKKNEGAYHATYNPKDSEQPLRYLFRFFLKLHIDARAQSWGIFSFLRNWFNVDASLKNALQQFANGCKDEQNSNEFEIVQGRHLL